MKNLTVFPIPADIFFILVVYLISMSLAYGQSDFKRWSVRPSLMYVDLSAASTSVNIGGNHLPGEDNLSFTNSTTFGLMIDFYLAKNISLHSVLALPPTTKGRGENSLNGAKAGTLRYGSCPVALVYHFDLKKLQPFVGAGINYTIIFKVEEQDFQDVQVDPKLGPMFRAGFDYMITEDFGISASVQKFYTKANITGLAPVGPEVTAPAVVEAELDPWMWSFGGIVRF